ncbi:neogenin-like isoform X2 [Watersipora subatra]|uniref:neogenin-like isoform X2 n=1 Tax=Watersipora subatra TaxID=2589382 RepID=UPI00355C0A3F
MDLFIKISALLILLHVDCSLCQATWPEFVEMIFTLEPQDIAVAEGSEALLPCSATYDGRSPTEYSWKRNNALMVNIWAWSRSGDFHGQKLENGSLLFPSVASTGLLPDIASYRCIAEVKDRSKVHRIATPEIMLSLIESPKLLWAPEEMDLLVGDTLMLRCSVESNSVVSYSWTRNGQPLVSSSRVLLHAHGSVLEVRALNRSDAGGYRCQAENRVGVVQSPPARLTVVNRDTQDHFGVSFVMRPWDTSVTLGSSATLYCALAGKDSNDNLPTVTWLKSGSTVDTSSGRMSIVGGASLQIKNTSLDDDDIYTCRGENLEEVADAAARLTVRVPPYFIQVPRNTYGVVNKDIVLDCEVGGIPPPRVIWLKDSEELHPSQYFRYTGHSLQIMGLMLSDAAYYQCMATNDLGKIHSIAQLIVLEEDVESSTSSPLLGVDMATPIAQSTAKPPSPTNLRAEYVATTNVTLKWTVDSEEGFGPVTKYRISAKRVGDSRLRRVNTTSQNYTWQNLQPNTEYIFTVRAINRNGYSEESAQIRRTTAAEIDVPSAVRNLKVWASSSQSIVVSFDPPNITYGTIIRYRIFHNDSYSFTNNTVVTIPNLHPYREYYIKVIAENANGQGAHDDDKVIRVRTFSAEPSRPPLNATLDASGSTTIALRWLPPRENSWNGPLTGYKIRCKAKASLEDSTPRTRTYITDADARSYEVTGLDAGRTYVVKIAAMNINGTGGFTPWMEATTYAVELDESRAPAKPTYVQLKAFSSEMIVSWGSTEDSDEVVVRGFRIGYGIGVPEQMWIENISPSLRIYTLTNLLPQKNYVVQVMAYNNAGTGAVTEQLGLTAESIQHSSELNPPVAVKAQVISSTSILLTWYDRDLGIDQNPEPGRIYTVKYDALSAAAQRKTEYRNTTERFMSLNGLLPYTKYGFSVMIRKGSRTSFYSLTARNMTLEAEPSSPPRDLTVTLIDNKPNMLMISWQPPLTPNGRIITYTIYSNTNYDQPLKSWIVEEVQGDQLNHEFGPVTASTLYFFKMAANNSKGASPPSATTTLQTPKEFGRSFRLGAGQDGDSPGGDQSVLPTSKPRKGGISERTLWIVIACVSTVTAWAIAALVILLCRRFRLGNKRKPANLKASNQAPKGMKSKQNGPNLWINHEQVEMKALNKEVDSPEGIDENTSMLRDYDSRFDVPSMVGDGYMHVDEPRYCTLGRQRPAVVAPYQQGDGSYETNPYSTMPRAAVPPMTNEHSRPLYPKTQFATQHPANIPRVHLGDTSQPITDIYGSYTGVETSSFCTDPLTGLRGLATPVSSTFSTEDTEPYNHVPSAPYYNTPYMIDGEEIPPPRPPPMQVRPQPLKFKNFNGTGHTIPKHIVKPQPMIFKPIVPDSEDAADQTGVDEDMLKPPRPPYGNRQLNHGSLGKDSLKMTLKSGSTEQLNTDMANFDNIMQDLSSCVT